ncbi:MAG: TonB-dependent receptor plug domain-containing protein [Bacteroidia bacterium]
MRKILILTVVTTFWCVTVKGANSITHNWAEFYSYLAKQIRYPASARQENLQGNSIITFSVIKGELKNVNVVAEMGKGCDIEVVNALMAYPQINTIKDGKFALKISFRLQGSNSPLINELTKMPAGFTTLNNVHVVGYMSNTSQVESSPKTSDSGLIKGYGMINNMPLVVWDDKIIHQSVGELDPNEIASVTILKDASAIELYGKDAINGVIVIKSKKTKNTTEASAKIGIENETNIALQGSQVFGKTPLYVLNGVVVDSTEFAIIQPANIKSVQILKDASALAAYGPNAANGVIIVTTKKEAPQKTKK